uniref:Neur_chan_LBD domain-containing protein n=1 Tax=Panagrellus redivivus TaxID=6233 RepID=A0A7E4VEL8_PANRE
MLLQLYILAAVAVGLIEADPIVNAKLTKHETVPSVDSIITAKLINHDPPAPTADPIVTAKLTERETPPLADPIATATPAKHETVPLVDPIVKANLTKLETAPVDEPITTAKLTNLETSADRIATTKLPKVETVPSARPIVTAKLTKLNSSPSERTLVNLALNEYDPRAIPDHPPSSPLLVEVSMILYKLIDVNEQEESVKLLLWSAQKWHDSGLEWAHYDGDNHNPNRTINIPAGSLWLPDGFIFNLMDSQDSIPLERTNVRVKGDGTTAIDIYKLVDIRCSMKVRPFPFDRQTIKIVFGSWSYTADKLLFNPTSASFDKGENSEWDIVSFTFNDSRQFFDGYAYQEIYYYLTIQRKPLFYIANIILPTFVVVGVSIIGLFVPHSAGLEREEKVTFGLTTLLTLCIMLQMLSTEMPKSSDGLPILGVYLIGESAISVIALLVSVGMLIWDECSVGSDPPRIAVRMFGDAKMEKKKEPAVKAVNGKLFRQIEEEVPERLTPLTIIANYYKDKELSDYNTDVWRRFLLTIDLTLCCLFLLFHTLYTVYVFYDHIDIIYAALKTMM